MTTLTGNTVYEYLNDLESQVKNLKESKQEDSGTYIAHDFFGSVISAEREFLKQINNGSAMISILGNGMPSIESLAEDIKSMGGLDDSIISNEEDLELFANLSSGYTQSLNEISVENGPKYKTIESEDFKSHLEGYDQDKIKSKKSYSIKENDDKFELILRESFFIEGYDKHSKEFPIAIRESKTNYQVVWNNLTSESKEELYVPENSKIIKKKKPVLIELKDGIFEDVKIEYILKKKYYKKVSIPGLFFAKKKVPTDLEKLVLAAAKERIQITDNIVAALNKSFNSKIVISDSDNDLNELLIALKFDYCYNEKGWTDGWIITRNIKFDDSNQKIGEIKYHAPSQGTSFGSIEVAINGSEFENKKQYLKLQRKLKPYRILL